MSGSTSLFGAALGHFDMFACIKLFGGIFAFVLGTAISGFLIEDSALKIGGHYSVVLLLESLLLACAVPCMQHNSVFGYYCAALCLWPSKCHGYDLQWFSCSNNPRVRHVH